MSECEACGDEPPQTLNESVRNINQKKMDEMMYGVSCECSECGLRIDPRDKIADIEGNCIVKEMFRDEQTDEPKFLEEESLTYGME